MKRNEEPIKNLLQQIARMPKFRAKLEEARVRIAWHKMQGTLISSYTKSMRFSGGTLSVTLTSAPLRQELSLQRKLIIEKLNTELEENLVQNLDIF